VLEPEIDTRTGLSPQTSNKTLALIAVSLSAFFVTYQGAALNVALPSINNDFHANAILLSWVMSVFGLANGVVSVPLGRISDIIGIKKIFLIGNILFSAVLIIAIFSNSIMMLIMCRLFLGLSAAMLGSSSIAIVASIFPPNERGKALGINIATAFFGLSAGPFLGGLIAGYLGWRSIFITTVPLSLLSIVLVLTTVKGEWAEAKGEKFDFAGSILYGMALIALMYGFSLLPGLAGYILIFGGILALAGFIKWESRILNPVLNIALFRKNKVFVFANLANLICWIIVIASAFVLSLFLQYSRGFTPEQAGLVLIAQPVTQAILSPFSGRLSDKFEPRVVSTIGMLLMFLSLLSLVFLSLNTSVIQIIISLIGLGIGSSLFSSPNSNVIMSSVTPQYYGVASSTIVTMRGMSQSLGLGLVMLVIAVTIGPVVITPEYYPAFVNSTRVIFAIFAVLGFGGIFASAVKA
jgi:EmrB/QacA subfamily drug resistance transporter